MVRPKSHFPVMKYHAGSGQARVWLDGKWYYLGAHGSPESQARYETLLAEYFANGKSMPEDEPTHQVDLPITVHNVAAEYERLIDQRPKLERYRHLCRLLVDEYGNVPAEDFGPRKLAELRDLMVASGNARPTANEYTRQIVRIFKHAVAMELIDVRVRQALEDLPPLRKGDSDAGEYKKRKPADLEHVRAAAEYLSPQARAIIIIQLKTGMRPSEVFNIRPMDIDRSGDNWLYRPEYHKTEGHVGDKSIPIIDEARDALMSFLLRPADQHCFSPAESAQWHRDQRHAARKTSEKQGNRPGTNRKANPKRTPGTKFNKDTLNRAITRACEKAGVPKWTPYQLRHTNASEVAANIGDDYARALLGHTNRAMTENYIHQRIDQETAIQAVRAAPTL